MKPSYASFLVQVAAVVAASNCSGAAKSIVDAANFKIGAVREPPANFALPIALNKTWVDLDLNATIQQAVKTIQRAHSEGVSLLAFPELYFPGYPVVGRPLSSQAQVANGAKFGYPKLTRLIWNSQAINTAYTASQIAQYVSQSMSTDSSEFKTLVSAFASANMYGSFGFSELADDKIYMGQVLIAPNGTVLMHRRKLRPSGTERDIWSDGDISGLEVIGTPYGRIGMLECWEHFHVSFSVLIKCEMSDQHKTDQNIQPTMTFAMQAQMENIHIASFPWVFLSSMWFLCSSG